MNVDYVRKTRDKVMTILGSTPISGVREISKNCQRDLTALFPKTSCHHYLDLIVNGNRVTAIINTGSNSSILSKGACDALGL